MYIAGPMRALVLLCWTSALCAANRPWSEDGGISWTGPDGARHVVKAAVRKWLGRRHVRVNATGAHVVEFSSGIPWLCAHGESRIPAEVDGAIVILQRIHAIPCVSENIYLAFRGAGARAVLAGVQAPVGIQYARVARARAPRPLSATDA